MESIFNKDQDGEPSNDKDFAQEDLFLAPEPKRSNDQHHSSSSDPYGKKKKDKSKKQIEAEEREKMRYFYVILSLKFY